MAQHQLRILQSSSKFPIHCDKTEMGSLAKQWPLKNSSMSRAKE
jgi:hypothetical protein